MDQPRLKAQRDELTALADDLDEMQNHLDRQVKRMDAIVDGIEAGWRGPAAKAYRSLHRGAAEDAVRIRLVLQRLEQAVRLSRDGFSAQDLEVMEQLRQVQADVDVAAEARDLSTPHSGASAPSRSRISDY
ncbi:WXG100 family type VII secretion target [Streptomyces somaliensis DSM 40738]|uniref:WXG100 family type VII secretion target n=1 Tax=Streptomyces somaliensis (strain ATCC 33201 / DSM 40738 / JCM 12659 / KCTC 9044 / NCTC 11332 / NRRL B-12077 / IP 733) TaxID=1134445 RepID=A0AA44DDQ4_STRE0|nr:WXG100 family type VII secretion target [Streptomyces somaliensis]MCQ0023273.1 WXG100 family type VII secretion target [Streptomyces somaliensis DSM 40738]NKY14867.1 WXG100 family type VII secretion target [Streptomyces somaliensis DSM 40738]